MQPANTVASQGVWDEATAGVGIKIIEHGDGRWRHGLWNFETPIAAELMAMPDGFPFGARIR